MIRLTERYTAENLEPLCDGWKMGTGYDVRLDRPVIILAISLSTVNRAKFDAWLAKRVTVSHPYTAEVLDGAALEKDFICVFEGTDSTRAGLPDLPRQALLSACLNVLQGAEELHMRGVQFNFSAGQVLWDGREPHVLGVTPTGMQPLDESQEKLARDLGLYFGRLCQWNVSSQAQSGSASQMSPLFRMGMEKLLGQGNGGCASFAEVYTTLQAMLMEDGILAGTAPTLLDHADPPADGKLRQARFDNARGGKTAVSASAGGALFFNGLDEEAPQADDDGENDGENAGTLRRSLVGGALIVGALLAGILAVYLWNALAAGTVAAGSGSVGQTSATGQNAQASGSKGAAGAGTGGSSGSAQSSGGSGSHRGTIPQVAGMSPQSAISQLVAAGIPAARVEVQAGNGSGAAGRVIATAPGAGSSLGQGQSVVIRVNVPSGYQLVPNLVGLPSKTAQATLLQDKFHFAYTDQSESRGSAGTVYSQTPQPYSIATPWSTVNFIVTR